MTVARSRSNEPDQRKFAKGAFVRISGAAAADAYFDAELPGKTRYEGMAFRLDPDDKALNLGRRSATALFGTLKTPRSKSAFHNSMRAMWTSQSWST
jgi:hypothetical protein